MGINVHLDDFETEYSSLALLNEFYVQFIKIDRQSFKQLNLAELERNLAISIITRARC